MFDMSKIQIQKQITTQSNEKSKPFEVCLICQRYKFKSKSQQNHPHSTLNTPKYWINNVKNNFLAEKRCKFCGKEKSLYICTPKCWSDGRVARHSSAKAATAVRIRFRPHQNSVRNHSNAVFLLFCHTFVILRKVTGLFQFPREVRILVSYMTKKGLGVT